MKNFEFFKADEMIYSYTAHKLGIDNTPKDPVVINNINYTLERLNEIRKKYGKPIRINSGYRCPELNKVVGGVANSQHTKGQAADLFWDKNLLKFIKDNCCYDQLIEEQTGNTKWIHISFNKNGERKQYIQINK